MQFNKENRVESVSDIH